MRYIFQFILILFCCSTLVRSLDADTLKNYSQIEGFHNNASKGVTYVLDYTVTKDSPSFQIPGESRNPTENEYTFSYTMLNAPWATINPNPNIVPSNSNGPFILTIDPQGLDVGTYTGSIITVGGRWDATGTDTLPMRLTISCALDDYEVIASQLCYDQEGRPFGSDGRIIIESDSGEYCRFSLEAPDSDWIRPSSVPSWVTPGSIPLDLHDNVGPARQGVVNIYAEPTHELIGQVVIHQASGCSLYVPTGPYRFSDDPARIGARKRIFVDANDDCAWTITGLPG